MGRSQNEDPSKFVADMAKYVYGRAIFVNTKSDQGRITRLPEAAWTPCGCSWEEVGVWGMGGGRVLWNRRVRAREQVGYPPARPTLLALAKSCEQRAAGLPTKRARYQVHDSSLLTRQLRSY